MERNSNLGFDIFRKRVKLHGTLRLVSGLHIGAGRALGPTVSDMPILKDFDANPFIPGSSFKGVLRSNLESWLRAFDECLACDPTDDNSRCINSTRKREILDYFGEDPDGHLLEQGCWICQLFGSPWVASKVHIVDMKVKGSWQTEWLMVRDGVVIDRESGTAASGGKYDFEAVPAGVEFQFEMVVENPEPYEMGLLALGIDLFNQGFALLGGNVSRGLGRATIHIQEISELTAHDLLAALQPPGAIPEQEKDDDTEQDAPADLNVGEELDEPTRALIDCLKEAVSLEREELLAAMSEKGIKRKTLQDHGYVKKKSSPWNVFFANAVKKKLIKISDDTFHLYGTELASDTELDQEDGEDSQVQDEQSQEIIEKLEQWKNALWAKLQPQERMKAKEFWAQFRTELETRKQNKEGANV